MAATLVGGAFLSAAVQTMMDKLTSTEFRDYINNSKLNVSLLEELETTLLTLQAVLDDAEHKQIKNQPVKQWLDQLKDAIFDTEDLLNEISYDSLRSKMESSEAENKNNQVWNFLASPFNSFFGEINSQISYDSLRSKMESSKAENKNNQMWNFLASPFNSFYGEINSQMKIMCQRLQLFSNQRDILGLQTVTGRVSHRTPSSSVVNEVVTVGRESDKKRLMNMLLSHGDTTNHNVGVIAVVGMGGVGKTTLAQLLYNNKEVQEHFDLKAWACVSDDFDILRVTKTLLESITSKAWETNNLDFLRVELKKISRDKKFLFVLDDLWNDNYNDWDELVSPFIDGKSGSMVIITTRQQKVAEVAHTFPIHKLKPLSNEETWSLLSKHAMGSAEFHGNKDSKLEEICRKISKKCGGLPIAAKTLGGLLRSKVDVMEWTAILNSDIWNLQNDNILPALHLSYQYLPSHLKRCFTYFSLFPKDYPLKRKNLVLLWKAEGFLEHSQIGKTEQEVGDDYIDELLSRSLIQQLKGGRTLFMHDLVNDLATVISGKSCCRLECGGNISKSVRHLSYHQKEHDPFEKFETSYNFKCLRSFLLIGSTRRTTYLPTKVVNDFIPTLKRLRVLCLSNYENIDMLLDSIGSLVQLRYLDLSHTGIRSLPDTICSLYNLQTLILVGCTKLIELPVNIGKLINLQCLDINKTDIRELPMQIVELKKLQTLNVFVVGKQDVGLSVKELRNFPKLSGKLLIKNLHYVMDATEARDANLKSNEQVEDLELQWGEQTENSQIERNVLDALQPTINLKKLSIELYGGTTFPSWLGDSAFSNMVSLCITKCEYCIILPPLGQLPSLKDLSIKGMKILETIGQEFYHVNRGGGPNSSFQPFPSLEILHFQDMSNWKEWTPFEGNEFPFPRLKTLKLYNCPELMGHLPDRLSSLQKFVINRCDHLLEAPPTMHWLSSIRDIHIGGGSSEREKSSFLETGSPHVNIYRHTLLSMFKMITSSNCLLHLRLFGISSLTAFPADGLPTSLLSIFIMNCENLSFLPLETWRNYTSLESLELRGSCNTLNSFQLDGFPALQSLHIADCESLESIFISESSSHHPLTLQSLWVSSCNALRSLPQQMDTLASLEKLSLFTLPKLELSLFEGSFLPSKLQSISTQNMTIMMPLATEWGLQRLAALSNLSIGGNDDIVDTMLKEKLLPISLVSLAIYDLSKLKLLDGNGLQHLSSLKSLHFRNCPRLECLPEDCLPSSLKMLTFNRCHLLSQRYRSEGGEHWCKISHIPIIRINGVVKI